MTVCIAAKALLDDKQVIVTVSDTKITTTHYSQELGAMKICRVHEFWSTMISGRFGQSKPLTTAIKERMAEHTKPSLQEVKTICTSVYIDEAKRLAEQSTIAKFGMSMEDFLNSRKKIGDSLFERTCGELSRIEVQCDLLMCGFDEDEAHIFCISNPTTDNPSFITDYDFPGFAAIGTGSYLAESTMYAFQQTNVTDLNRAIYHATTAKFIAEAASDVGESTILLVLEGGGYRIGFKEGLEEKLRERWMLKGRPSVPLDALTMIDEAIANSTPEPEKPEEATA